MDRSSSLRLAAIAIGASLALMWSIEIVDIVVFDEGLDRHGILPRTASGLDGVLWAPLLHGGLGHLASNSVPFAVLGGLVMTEGARRWASVTAIVAIGGGVLTWLLARSRIHIGASGIVFGYLGYLLAKAYFTRSLRSIAIALVVGVVYGGALVVGLIPRPGISWESHAFGVMAGVAAAIVLNADGRSAQGP
ncbi:MAG: rhomboid family intramembrane serine protease [Acidimicrobiia bacterium]|nr:rhomboid family intramembrane serine protease [Acidimicrobiia bacterium]